MMDYDYSPIDVINESGKWISTYRYEPYLKNGSILNLICASMLFS